MKQAVQRGYAISITGDLQTLTGHDLEQPALSRIRSD